MRMGQSPGRLQRSDSARPQFVAAYAAQAGRYASKGEFEKALADELQRRGYPGKAGWELHGQPRRPGRVRQETSMEISRRPR